jgi:hypothetical protein
MEDWLKKENVPDLLLKYDLMETLNKKAPYLSFYPKNLNKNDCI